jgi:hypothetical protein
LTTTSLSPGLMKSMIDASSSLPFLDLPETFSARMMEHPAARNRSF